MQFVIILIVLTPSCDHLAANKNNVHCLADFVSNLLSDTCQIRLRRGAQNKAAELFLYLSQSVWESRVHPSSPFSIEDSPLHIYDGLYRRAVVDSNKKDGCVHCSDDDSQISRGFSAVSMLVRSIMFKYHYHSMERSPTF